MLGQLPQEADNVLSLLFMSFDVQPKDALSLAEEWFKKHRDASWSTLEKSLRTGEVIVKNQALYDVPVAVLVQQMRGKNGIEIKDRWYNLKLYHQCFIGSEAVEWLMQTQQVSKKVALLLGQLLVAKNIIHHVTDDHDFKDEYLFYRFYLDE